MKQVLVSEELLLEIRHILRVHPYPGWDGVWSAKRKVEALLEKPQFVEPYGCVTIQRLSQRLENHVDRYSYYKEGEPPYLDNVDECVSVYREKRS